MICIDTLRADRLSAYGHNRETSPTIDAGARKGVLFERTLAHSSWTVPATASLLTSLLPSQHGAGLEEEVRLLSQQPPKQMRPGVRTLAQILADHDFSSALFSANPYLYGRFHDGFDHTVTERMDGTQLTDQAISWISENENDRFFVYIQYMDLHQPLKPPDRFFRHFDAGVPGERSDIHSEWSYGKGEHLETPGFVNFREHRLAAYDGALLYVDGEIQRILDRLELMGDLDSTLVVITSDHGEEFWDHAKEEIKLGGDPRGFYGVGHGHSMFQELLHVPLVIWGPGIEPDNKVAQWIRHIDVMPTVLDLLSLPVPEEIQGASLLPLVTKRGSVPTQPLVASSPAYGPDSQAIIVENMKLIVRIDEKELLFDLYEDPLERVNLAKEKPETVATLRAQLALERAQEMNLGNSEEMVIDDKTEEQLRALGYLD